MDVLGLNNRNVSFLDVFYSYSKVEDSVIGLVHFLIILVGIISRFLRVYSGIARNFVKGVLDSGVGVGGVCPFLREAQKCLVFINFNTRIWLNFNSTASSIHI